MTILEHVWHSAQYGAKLSPFDDLKAFFCEIKNQDESVWPLNMSETGYTTKYSRAAVVRRKLGFDKILLLDAACENSSKSYLLAEDICISSDKLEVYLVSMRRENKDASKRDEFVHHFIEKHYLFLRKLAKEKGVLLENALMRVEAHSNEKNSAEARGGYVWATHGFDFSSVHELNEARICFKKFAAQKGVSVSLKDLVRFKYPCHFAAFRCLQNGQVKNLGKDFLLQYTWHGKISASMSQNSELYRYAKTYHEKNKAEAEKELSKPFLEMMKRYIKPDIIKDLQIKNGRE